MIPASPDGGEDDRRSEVYLVATRDDTDKAEPGVDLSWNWFTNDESDDREMSSAFLTVDGLRQFMAKGQQVLNDLAA